MRDGDWKLLVTTEPLAENRRVIEHINNAKIARFELYNLKADPTETTNLSTKNPEVYERMKATFLKLHRQILDEGPDWDLEEHRNKSRQAWPEAYGRKGKPEAEMTDDSDAENRRPRRPKKQ